MFEKYQSYLRFNLLWLGFSSFFDPNLRFSSALLVFGYFDIMNQYQTRPCGKELPTMYITIQTFTNTLLSDLNATHYKPHSFLLDNFEKTFLNELSRTELYFGFIVEKNLFLSPLLRKCQNAINFILPSLFIFFQDDSNTVAF